jgi:DegV family protein with EDD domain
LSVAVVTDSASDLSADQLAEWGIRNVPLSVSFGNETLFCPDELSTDQFWQRLLAPGSPFPRTSAASADRFGQAFESALAEGHEAVVCVCLTKALSAAFEHASMAAGMLPGKPIFVIDSGTGCMGIGVLALAAARMAAAGKRAEQIVDALGSMKRSVDLFVALDTLKYLRKGGHLRYATAAIGGLLSVKPIFTIHDGLLVVAAQPRTRRRATEQVIGLLTQRSATELHVQYSPPFDPEPFTQLVLERMPKPKPKTVTVSVIGPAIGAHLGPGAYGAVLVHEG